MPKKSGCSGRRSRRLPCWWTKVGDSQGQPVEADGLAGAQGDGKVRDGPGHLLPPVVRLGAVEEQELGAVVIGEEVQDEAGHLHVPELAGLEARDGPAGTVVDDPVDIEGGQALVLECQEQLLDRERAGVARVHGAVEVVEEDARGDRARQAGEGVERRLDHPWSPLVIVIAVVVLVVRWLGRSRGRVPHLPPSPVGAPHWPTHRRPRVFPSAPGRPGSRLLLIGEHREAQVVGVFAVGVARAAPRYPLRGE